MNAPDILTQRQSDGCGRGSHVGMFAGSVATERNREGGQVGRLVDGLIRNSRSDGPGDRALYGMGERPEGYSPYLE